MKRSSALIFYQISLVYNYKSQWKPKDLHPSVQVYRSATRFPLSLIHYQHPHLCQSFKTVKKPFQHHHGVCSCLGAVHVEPVENFTPSKPHENTEAMTRAKECILLLSWSVDHIFFAQVMNNGNQTEVICCYFVMARKHISHLQNACQNSELTISSPTAWDLTSAIHALKLRDPISLRRLWKASRQPSSLQINTAEAPSPWKRCVNCWMESGNMGITPTETSYTNLPVKTPVGLIQGYGIYIDQYIHRSHYKSTNVRMDGR